MKMAANLFDKPPTMKEVARTVMQKMQLNINEMDNKSEGIEDPE